MKVTTLLLTAMIAALPGCKIVYDTDRADEIPAGPDGDDARNAARLDDTFDTRLLPRIRETAVSAVTLRERLSADGMDRVGMEIGNQGSGRGAAWNFSVSDSGTIVAAKLDTSAKTIDVDVDGDRKSDVTVQLGPVIRGTALRDVAPFFVFDDFRDQIEFAKLARAINNKIKPTLVVPEGALIGSVVRFTGVIPLKKPDSTFVLTPIVVEFSQ
jgi:predicted lipoprotein